MIYALILVATLLILCLGRVVYLNSEIRTIKNAGVKFRRLLEKWEAEFPIDYSSPESISASKARMPKDLKDAETEYAWATNALDSKKGARTIWYGATLLSLVGLVAAFVEVIRS